MVLLDVQTEADGVDLDALGLGSLGGLVGIGAVVVIRA